VKSVQQELNSKNYNAGTADGFMGQKTRKALRQYQEDLSLSVTGRVDNATLVSLGLRQSSSSVPESIMNTDRAAADDDDEEEVEVRVEGPSKPAVKTSDSVKYVTNSMVELQAADDLFSETLVKIPAGTTLNILSVDGDWYKVAYKKKEGYVMAEFVEQK
jgi:peptidoglycan hydrolase-like protein with peptidoglycan-binding domain